MSSYLLNIKRITEDDLIPLEEVLKKDSLNPFLGPGDRPEPYRTQYIAYARLKRVFEKEKLQASPLILNTPRGAALSWCWWPTQIGVVLLTDQGTALDGKVTFLNKDEFNRVSVDLTRIVLNPPRWS